MTCAAMKQCLNSMTELVLKYEKECFLRRCDTQTIQLKRTMIQPEQKIARHTNLSPLDSPKRPSNKDKLSRSACQSG